MENKPYASVIGNSAAPYENALARQCGAVTNYHGITHPSLPNYLAATGGSTFGVTDDAGPSAHPIGAASIFGQLDQADLSWRSYNESMPRNCDPSPSGRYAVKHNPAAYFTAARASCLKYDVALDGNFDHDIAAGTLPSFSFVTPDLCSDTHDCSVAVGDAWLATWIPRIVNGPDYRSGTTVVVLTWDEGVGSSNLIPGAVVAPGIPAGTVDSARLDHYALLRTTEEILGLPALGAAATAPSMRVAFHL
jgi:phosphatidylinositol-3-phosphatase